jgi:transcriptional regulator with XRE-family HTH domain
MLTVETIGRIRREHFIKGKTIKEIARDLKVSRNTVRRVLRSGATSFEYDETFSPDRSLGDGLKNSMRSWQATQPSQPASS